MSHPRTSDPSSELLRQKDIQDYERLVTKIRDLMPRALELYEALLEIKQRSLWKLHYPSYEDFCRAEFNFGARRAHQIVSAGTFLRESGLHATTVPPTDKHARELMRLRNPVLAKRIWNEACVASGATDGERPPLSEVASRVDAILDTAEKVARELTLTDATGKPVPDNLKQAFMMTEPLRMLYQSTREWKRRLNNMQDAPGMELYSQVQFDGAFALLQRMLKDTIPYALCPNPDCDGGCEACHRYGWVTQVRYNELEHARREAESQPGF